MDELGFEEIKIKKVTAYDQVYEKIKDAVLQKKWKVGERLPSEPALAAAFGVNRLTVRMAIQKLNALGIAETKIGDGTYIKQFDMQPYFQEVSPFFMKPELLENVCDFRKLIEIECARLAMEHATPEDLSELKALSEEYARQARVVEKNYDAQTLAELTERDLSFHYKICQMSHNELYAFSYQAAKEAIYQYLLIILRQRIEGWRKKGKPVSDGRHEAIYEAIAKKDFPLCQKIYLEMVDHHIEL